LFNKYYTISPVTATTLFKQYLSKRILCSFVYSVGIHSSYQGVDQRRPGKRLYVRTVKHVSGIKRMSWTVANGER